LIKKDTEINICWTNETRKSINYKYMQIAAVVLWRSRMQKTIALSTAEAEYYSASDIAVEIIFLRNLIRNMGLPQEDDTVWYDDMRSDAPASAQADACKAADQEFYHVLSPHNVSNVEIERPLYDQIVQQEIIELHKLQTLIESKGGKVTDLNTDVITCTFEDNKLPFELSDGKNIDGYFWDY
jgi:hypothetical protein